MALLEVKGLTKRFGGVTAVCEVDFAVEEGSITAVIGPNGAGKTTCFNMITGLYEPCGGEVRLHGRGFRGALSGRRPDEIARSGVARTFQNIRLCETQTVLDNVRLGLHRHGRATLLDALLHTRRFREEEASITAAAREALRFVGLAGGEVGEAVEALLADGLPYGKKRLLEIARALASSPELLLLDEPAAGMNPHEKGVLEALIRKIRERGVTILLIEHDMKLVMQASDRVVVLDHGEKIADGSPEVVRRDAKVIEAYLGAESAHEAPREGDPAGEPGGAVHG